MEDIGRHEDEILGNRAHWEKKPLLRSCYHAFYREIAARLKSIPGLTTLELGSGIGAIKDVIPQCVTSDIFDNPWLDRRENAYAIQFPDAALSDLILFDVFHHLEFPGTALAEMARVVVPGGRLIVFEPDMSLLGKFVYGCCHPEPLGLGKPITWTAPPGVDAASGGYYAGQANATRIFRKREVAEWENSWRLVATRRLTNLRYFGSGGFSGPQLLPSFLEGPLKVVENVLSLAPGLFSARLLLVLERREQA
ncbi:MAG TPA: methyltransferase domain-containing protein [Chthoniobacterales bacterium]